MKELKCGDSITITTTTTSSDTESDCTSSSSAPASPSHQSSSPHSFSSLSEEEIENNQHRRDNNIVVREIDQEEKIVPHHHHCDVVNMFSYAPQHQYNRTKIRDIEEDDEDGRRYIRDSSSFGRVTLPRSPNKKTKKLTKPRTNFIFMLVAVASVSLVLSSFALSIYSPILNFTSSNNNLPLDEKQLILNDVFSQVVTDEQFTIRISVSSHNKHLNLLINSIDSHSVCPRVKQIQVDWHKFININPSDNIINHDSQKVVIVNSSVQSSSDVTSVSTNAVLLLSDDVVLTCFELDRAFHIWKQNPERMVGFFPYHYQEQSNSPVTWTLPKFHIFKSPYKLTDIQNKLHTYSVMSDRASFIHRLYLRTTLDTWMSSSPCGSIALSLKITSMSRKPPMMVANSKPLQLQTSATMKNINRNRHEQWLKSSSTCFSSIMKYLHMNELPIENRYFVNNIR